MNPKAADPTDVAAQRKALLDNYPKLVEAGHIIVGTPKTVIPKIRKVLEQLRPGFFAVWGPEGPIPHENVMRMLELMGQEVLPAMHEMAKDLDLVDAFQVELGARPLPASGQWAPLVPDVAA